MLIEFYIERGEIYTNVPDIRRMADDVPLIGDKLYIDYFKVGSKGTEKVEGFFRVVDRVFSFEQLIVVKLYIKRIS